QRAIAGLTDRHRDRERGRQQQREQRERGDAAATEDYRAGDRPGREHVVDRQARAREGELLGGELVELELPVRMVEAPRAALAREHDERQPSEVVLDEAASL